MLFVARCLLLVVCCRVLFVACYGLVVLLAVCCMMFLARRRCRSALFVVRGLLSVGVCSCLLLCDVVW